MTGVMRPALAEVLAALTGCDRLSGDAARVGRVVSDGLSVRMRNVETGDEFTGVVPWTHASPAESVEALATAALWPWEPGDDPTRWWCDECGGSGTCGESWKRSFVKRCSACRDASCGRCGGRGFTVEGDGSNAWDADAVLCTGCNGRSSLGHTADPPSHAALVAVASLGAPLLLRITHTLAPEIARAAGRPDARVVWRVMGREEIDAWAQRGDDRVTGEAPRTIPQSACIAATTWASNGWTGPSTWWLPESPADVVAAWPAVLEIVAAGALPVALDASRIVLAVEAIGGDR